MNFYKLRPIFYDNFDKIYWDYLSFNPNAISILENNTDKIYWKCLSENPNAIHILEKNLDKIHWDCLSENPNAISLLEKNLDKINWNSLSKNPNAISLLEKNLEKNLDIINWDHIWANPSIFMYDYNLIKETNKNINEEIIKVFYHPSMIEFYLDDGNDLEDIDAEIESYSIQNISHLFEIIKSIK